MVAAGAGAEIVNVTGTVVEPLPAFTVMVAVYFPAVIPVGLMDTVRFAGVFPVVGETDNQVAPGVTVNEAGEDASTRIVWGAAVAAPSVCEKVNDPGNVATAIAVPVIFNVTGTFKE